jgi:hypothetical protein
MNQDQWGIVLKIAMSSLKDVLYIPECCIIFRFFLF